MGIVAALAVVAGWLLWLVNNPATVDDPSGDAIFVHAGGQGERVEMALQLFDEGAAPVLVLSNPEPGSVPSGLCESGSAVICVIPSPADTAGEALSLGKLVDERGWNRVIVVTSDYHLRRASMLDRSCTNADVVPVEVRSRRSARPISDVEVREAIALIVSWLAQPCG
jgi:hypothetical protein